MADFRIKRSARTPRHFWRYGIGVAIVAVTLLLAGLFWYQHQLQPRDTSATGKVRVIVSPGQNAAQIADTLESAKVIRSASAFRIYTELSRTKKQLQAGAYALSPSLTVSEIVDHMSTGQTDEMAITILPGTTLDDIKKTLVDDGFSADEVDAAFVRQYNHPLFKDKPSGTSLEGYIYPETYNVYVSDGVDVLLKKSFDEFYKVIQKNNIETALQARSLTLYQGITLASIVQKEADKTPEQRQIAQVFYKRLSDGIQLGSDVTYMYAAKKAGVVPTPSFESPYNTRIHTGLPPGPIANFNLTTLQATVSPAEGDYLYFVAGDDGEVYFTRTEAEHQAAIEAHCHTLCH